MSNSLLARVAKLCWQDRRRGAPWVENCLGRLAGVPGRASRIARLPRAEAALECLDYLRRGDWEYETHDDIFGSLWFVNGPSVGLTIIPGCRAYRLSTASGDWSWCENNWGRPVRFRSGEGRLAEGSIGFADLDPVRPESVPGEVYVLAMLHQLAGELDGDQKS